MPLFWSFKQAISGGSPGTGLAPEPRVARKINEATKRFAASLSENGMQMTRQILGQLSASIK
jgi:hypothetical protein